MFCESRVNERRQTIDPARPQSNGPLWPLVKRQVKGGMWGLNDATAYATYRIISGRALSAVLTCADAPQTATFNA
jgi:hypothetical protein